MYTEETICAISTKLGESAINIVRLSGKKSLEILERITKQDKESFIPRKLVLKKIYDDEEIIDVSLVTYFESGNSYNGETIVEINTHGGIIVAQRVLELMIKCGARLAEPGEFTKRAFFNKKMSLEQIEAVSNIINSQTKLQHKVSVNQYNGSLDHKIEKIKSKIMDTIAAVEVNIDYPEYDETEEITEEFVLSKINSIYEDILSLQSKIKNGKILKNGINATIVGKPNVGKSSLLNALTNDETSIVTDIEGTTRDVVSETIKINEFVLNILDTAGIRSKTNDIVEEIGIKKSKKAIEYSDVIFFVFDLSREFDNEDMKILNLLKDKNVIFIGNKSDIKIEQNIQFEYIEISSKKLINIEALEKLIFSNVFNGNIEQNDFIFLSSIEKEKNITNVFESLNIIRDNVMQGNIFIDFLIIDLTNMYEELSKLNNSHKDGEILDRLFSSYCLGK